MSETRRIVGGIVYAKAIHVTNEKECGRRYGRNESTKLVQGHVAEVHNGESRTGRSQCFLTCDFDFGLGVSKRKKLNIRSVKSGPPPVAVNSEIPAQYSQNSQITAAYAIEAAAANFNDAGNATINLLHRQIYLQHRRIHLQHRGIHLQHRLLLTTPGDASVCLPTPTAQTATY
jgi:hypothetical protein